MTIKKVKCDSCNSRILETTKIKCNGYCMPCYMKSNHGFRPSELEAIRERGLSEQLHQWNDIVRRGIPKIRNPSISQRLNQSIPIVYSSVTAYFRSRDMTLEGNSILKLLTEFKSISDSGLEQYISKIEFFMLGLISATKSLQIAPAARERRDG